MTNTTRNTPILTPDEVLPLLIQPVQTLSVAAQVSTIVNTSAHTFRVPVVTADPTAAWVAEGEEISPSDAQLAETTAELRKLAGLTIISNELRDDSTPQAAGVIGEGLARDLSRKLDEAFFGALTAPAPSGLAALPGVSTIDAGGPIVNTDPFAEAVSAAEVVGATLTNFAANPADLLALAKVKKAAGSNEPLLAVDATQPARRTVAGVPVLASPAVPAGTIWGIPTDRVYVVMHDQATIEVDGSVYFTSDRSAIRAKLRAGFAFPHAAAVVKINTAPAK